MDPYIINNMPDDDVLEADLEMIADGNISLKLVHDGDSYVLTVGLVDSDTGSVVAAFDPTCNLETVLSFLAVIRTARVAGGSAAANAIATDLKARADAAQDASEATEID